VTPSRAGDYLVLGEATAREAPCTSGGVGVRVTAPAGQIWPSLSGAFPNRVTSYQGCHARPGSASSSHIASRSLAARPASSSRRARVTPRAATSATHGSDVSGSTGSTPRNSAAVAAELAASDVPIVASRLQIAPAPRYLIMHALVVSTQASGLGVRRVTFKVDGAPQVSFSHAMDNENYRTAYGGFYVRDGSRGARLDNTIASGTAGAAIEAKDSVIHALEVSEP
jgi:hypothetical protein